MKITLQGGPLDGAEIVLPDAIDPPPSEIVFRNVRSDNLYDALYRWDLSLTLSVASLTGPRTYRYCGQSELIQTVHWQARRIDVLEAEAKKAAKARRAPTPPRHGRRDPA